MVRYGWGAHRISCLALPFDTNHAVCDDPHLVPAIPFPHDEASEHIAVCGHNRGIGMLVLHAATDANQVVELQVCRLQTHTTSS